MQKAHSVLAETIPSYPPPRFYLEEVVVFPTSIALMAYEEEVHTRLIHELDEKLTQAGIPDDKKYFSTDIYWANITSVIPPLNVVRRTESGRSPYGWCLIPLWREKDLVSWGCEILHFVQNDLIKTVIEFVD